MLYGVCRTVTALQTARNESVLDHEHNVCCGGEREREERGYHRRELVPVLGNTKD